jgi:PilZ domain
MSQTASPGSTPHFELLARDVVAVGDPVDIAAGSRCTRGVIVALAPSTVTISLPGPIGSAASSFTLTRTDHDGATWTATCFGRVITPRRLEITERIHWTAVDRSSARITADRRAVQAEWEENQQVLRQRGLVALDVSASGCRLSGIGAAPPAGAVVKLDISATTYGESQRLSAQVMRVESSAFGRYLLGLRFLLDSADDYSRVLAWRDASLRR